MRRWLNQEITWAISGPMDLRNGASEKVYRARSLDQNFRLAHALLEVDPESLDPFEKVKVYLARGEHDLAREILDSVTPEDPLDIQEHRHEQIRLATFEGHWQLASEIADELIQAGGIGLTTQSAFQMRSGIRVELGDFNGAAQDLEKVEVLSSMYPHSFSNFHARCQSARLLSLSGRQQESDALRARLWCEVLEMKQPNYDYLISLTRLELLGIPAGLNSSTAATHISLQATLASHTGDDLYLALAWLYATQMGLKPTAQNQLPRPVKSFRRIQLLESEQFTEGQHLKFLKKYFTEINGLQFENFHGVFFSECGKYLDIQKKKMLSLTQRQIQLLTLVIQQPGMETEALFSAVTEVPYTKHLHKNYVSNLIYQLNKKIGPRFFVQNQKVFLTGIGVLAR